MDLSTTFGCLVYRLTFVTLIFISNLAGIDGSEDLENKMLDSHNKYREMHGVGRLHLSKDVSNKAMQCAKHYVGIRKIDHSCKNKDIEKTDSNPNGILGENLYIAKGEGDSIEKTPDEEFILKAVDGWYIEYKDYDFAKGEKKDPSNVEMMVGHFTQLVWKTSTNLGVALLRSEDNDLVVVVCLYNPPGNIKKKYQDNVLPQDKSKGEPSSDGGNEDGHEARAGSGDSVDSKVEEWRLARARNPARKPAKSSRLQVSWGYMTCFLLAFCVPELYSKLIMV